MNENIKNSHIMPFWFWNGEMCENEITRQLELAANAKLRGFALHARVGNKIEYMSARWIDLCKHVCKEAKRLGLEIWIYDEKDFPSGTVGGKIFENSGDEYKQKYLSFQHMLAKDALNEPNFFIAFDANNPEIKVDCKSINPNSQVLVFCKGFSPLLFCDALNPKTAKKFIELTHDVYYKEIKEYFNEPIKAFYTDDLNILCSCNKLGTIPWTDSFPEAFEEKNGYSIIDKLGLLVEDVNNYQKVRFDYRLTVMQLFLENFVQVLGNWCDAHKMLLTGHLSGDESPTVKGIERFSSAMPFFKEFPIPGIDEYLLAIKDSAYLRNELNDLNFSIHLICKLLTSATNQYCSGSCSSEVLTSRGWGVPVSEQFSSIRFQLAMGIDVLVPHAFSYSTAKMAKRDHPASYFFQQPYFAVAEELWREIIQSNELINRGKSNADILVINNIYGAWISCNGNFMGEGNFQQKFVDENPSCNFYEENLAKLCLTLLQKHYEFEIGDELLMRENCCVTATGKLKIGNCIYSKVIIPEKLILREETKSLLKEFISAGGTVVYAENLTLEDNKYLDWSFANKEIAKEVLVKRTAINDNNEFYLINFGTIDAKIIIDQEKYFVYDPKVGCHYKTTYFIIPPLGGIHLLKTVPKSSKLIDYIEVSKFNKVLNFEKITTNNPNLLLIDCAKINGEMILFSEINIPPKGILVEVEFSSPAQNIIHELYFEPNQLNNLHINGEKVEKEKNFTHFASQDLLGINIEKYIKDGYNLLSFEADGSRIESFYISGEFTVSLSKSEEIAIPEIKMPQTLKMGDLSSQGLPFYWGSVDYDCILYGKGDEQIILGSEINGVVEIYINSKRAGIIYQAPWVFNIPKNYLTDGENQIKLRLYNTAQNLFGPHRRENIYGENAITEGSSKAAWKPVTIGNLPTSWGIAPFGIL